MERSRLFEAVLVLAMIGLAGLLCYGIVAMPPPDNGWETVDNGIVDYLFTGGNDTLYTFSGNHVAAIRSDGSRAWTFEVPEEWRVINRWLPGKYTRGGTGYGRDYRNVPIADEQSGFLYLYLTRPITQAHIDMANRDPDIERVDVPSQILAINSSGGRAWAYDFSIGYPSESLRGLAKPEYVLNDNTISIKASGDRIYLFYGHREDVLDSNGRLLFSLDNVSAPVSVDGRGHIFSVGACWINDSEFYDITDNSSYIGEVPVFSLNGGYTLPSGIVQAYDIDGSLLWSRDLGVNAVYTPMTSRAQQEYDTLPLYVNDTLYVPLNSGVAALDTAGNLKWVRHVTGGTYALYGLMPADRRGNVYLEEIDYGSGRDDYFVTRVAPDGNLSPDQWHFARTGYRAMQFVCPYPMPSGGNDGVVYTVDSYPLVGSEAFMEALDASEFGADTIRAIDLGSDRELWNFTIPYADRHAIVLNESNFGDTIRSNSPGSYPYSPFVANDIRAYPGNGITFVSYYFAILDNPVIFNRSRCFYARGLYALDNRGRLLWELHPDGFVERAAAGNDTIFYATSDGRLGGNPAGIAAGIALTALAYLFLRFFAMGTVMRARGRLDGNENRNSVLRYITGHPGLTATDLSRSLGMNLGTLRYHLFVLTVNHKVITHREDDRFLRYFRNSGAYSAAEQTLLSLLRREPLRKTLDALAASPGLSGSALARELGVSPTAANRHLSLLVTKGIVEPAPGKGGGYDIKSEHRERVERAMELLRQRV